MSLKSGVVRPKKKAKHIEGLTPEQHLEIYYFMKLSRNTELRIINLYRQGKIVGGVYTGIGQEAIAVGSAYCLEDGDVLVPLHRDLGAHFVRGMAPRILFAQYLGRRTGSTRGRDGNTHIGDISLNVIGMISHLGTMTPVAAGAALACKMKKNDRVVLNFIGDGGSSTGDFHEGLNFASVYKLPLILIIENNQYAYSTPTKLQYACKNLADRGHAYGVPGVIVDGNDVMDVYRATKEAIERARRGEGPTLIEAKTMRMRGHSEHDDHFYVPKQLLEEWKKKDPINRYSRFLAAKKILTAKVEKQIAERIEREIDESVEFAEKSPYPEGHEALEGVYSE